MSRRGKNPSFALLEWYILLFYRRFYLHDIDELFVAAIAIGPLTEADTPDSNANSASSHPRNPRLMARSPLLAVPAPPDISSLSAEELGLDIPFRVVSVEDLIDMLSDGLYGC